MDLKRLNSGLILLLHLLLVDSTLFLGNTYLNKILEIPRNNEPCKVHENKGLILSLISKIASKFIPGVPPDTFDEISKACSDVDQLNKTRGFRFPGTKWCGPGKSANGYNDLGKNVVEDSCCRDHDHCPNYLEAGQCRHGVCNTSPYTRSHCECDAQFRSCLQNSNSTVANIIGSLYFNVAQMVCFTERRSCPQSMRDNLSYSWFCEEWKFTPGEYYTPSVFERANSTYHPNEIPDEGRVKSNQPSKIDRDLEKIFGKEEDITNIMNDFKTLRN